jgi:branched-subunit amino acid aminotransferase/4-amino-4-deoxychorismate lyase
MSEVLIASSTRNIVPVVKVDDTVIGEGIPGPMVKRLNEILTEYQKTY